MHLCWLAPEAGQREQIENCSSGHPISHNCPSTCPSLSQEKALSTLISHYRSTLGQGLAQLSKNVGCKTQRQLRPKMACKQVGTAITAPTVGSTSEVVPISDGVQTITTCVLTHTEKPHMTCLPCCKSPHEEESCRGQREG